MPRYASAHKERVRRKIIDGTITEMRTRGAPEIGIARVMRSKGLTHGTFYHHFRSVDQLRCEAALAAIDDTITRWKSAGQNQRAMRSIVANYLSDKHRDEPGLGCGIPAFIDCIARGPGVHKKKVGQKFSEAIDVLSRKVRGRHSRSDATALLALMVGSLVLSRASARAPVSNEFLSGGRRAAQKLVDDGALPRPRQLRVDRSKKTIKPKVAKD